jgi:hypothetical protein
MFSFVPDTVTACCFQKIGPPHRFWREPPPDENPSPSYPPLNAAERAWQFVAAGMGCFTFLALLAIIILAHTPFVAN